MPFFAEVLIPLPVPGTFTYRIPENFSERIQPGVRVAVPFGSRKIYAGLTRNVHEIPPNDIIPKEILSAIDDKPVVNERQFLFWDWLAAYYLCTTGEVMQAALPSALKLSSESKVILHPEAQYNIDLLNEKERLLTEALENRKRIPISETPKIIGQQKFLPVIRNMIDKGIIIMEEELQEKYRPRKETFVLLTDTYEQDEDALKKVFDRLEQRAPKQLTLLITWIRLSRFGFGIPQSVVRSELLRQAGASAAQLDPLVRKGVFRLEERKIIRQGTENGIHDEGAIRFTAAQEAALEEIRSAFDSREVVLLHGVTSSGKTEMYIRLIGETLSKGKQVLYLLPEIALTAQIINRLKKYFGDRVGVYHSRFSDQERVEIWNTRFDIILGARSAVFLPFRELGLIIVDEEHDSSYKQMDPAPRYNGRDAAMVLARIHQAKTLLGSATPSVESYYNAKQGKYALVELTERYGNMELPKIRVVNIRDELRKGTMRSHFSSPLMQQLTAALEHREQSILFQNRRGFSLRLECDTCQWMPACKNCDVTLVYHKKWNQLRCHYCGYVSRVPETCPQCHGTYLKMKGFGTEKVEEELGLMLPDARILRMDLDTTRSRHAHRRIIEDFEAGKIDIMVGTQMVTKGLDFDRVSTVCILNADNMLGFPDFRSEERSFQLMAQVSGRSGRRYRQGEVIIQTYNPYHPVIRDVVNHDYMSMYLRQIADRKKYRYPPLYRLVQIRIKHRELNKMIHAADALAVKLRQQFGNRVLGPEFPLVARIMNYHIKHIMIKFERSVKLTEQKQILSRILTGFASDKNYPGIRLIIDVDPS